MEKQRFSISFLHQEHFSWLQPEGAGRPHELGGVNFYGVSAATSILPKDSRKTSLTLSCFVFFPTWLGIFWFSSHPQLQDWVCDPHLLGVKQILPPRAQLQPPPRSRNTRRLQLRKEIKK